MILKLDFEELESRWKARQLDLFPWLDGLFALIRSRNSLIRETRKRLSSSNEATMVQFLASNNHDNVMVAREVIKKQQPESILPILLYTLEKVDRDDYHYRVMESILDFDPAVSLGYLIGYLYLKRDRKDKVFEMLGWVFVNLQKFYPFQEEKMLDQNI